ncbi:MAG: hypothetical protein H6807_09535 [Planctomycetes bacterium]|nr:hypothetical protein [Planctomycetota bacterium]
MADAPFVKHTKSFKKYSAECRPEVVEACRVWTSERGDRFQVHEDASLIKVTGSQADIDEMVASLRERFGSPLPGEDPPAEK